MSRSVKSRLSWKSLPVLLPFIVILGLGPIALAKLNKDTVAVPGGLAFSEFKGYEQWEFISLSHGEKVLAAIVGNPAMSEAFKSGIRATGNPFPAGAKRAKINWLPTKMEDAPGQPTVPGTLHDVDFMVKDSKRFADSGGWGYAQFEYDQTKDEFRPGTVNDTPPQENDAKCGFACHTLVESKDYVFTSYQKR